MNAICVSTQIPNFRICGRNYIKFSENGNIKKLKNHKISEKTINFKNKLKSKYHTKYNTNCTKFLYKNQEKYDLSKGIKRS